MCQVVVQLGSLIFLLKLLCYGLRLRAKSNLVLPAQPSQQSTAQQASPASKAIRAITHHHHKGAQPWARWLFKKVI